MLASEIVKSKSRLAEAAVFEIDVDRAQDRVVVHQRHAQRVGIVLQAVRRLAGALVGDPDGLLLLADHVGQRLAERRRAAWRRAE